ncbi:MAG: transposase [Planctomycetota bacterium]|nr:transposase [Planctomycetota bacterium]
MIGLLTWPAYGTWLPGPARGWVDPGSRQQDTTPPEPDEALSAHRRRALKWPPVRLDDHHRRVILDDLGRIAEVRRFRPLLAVAAVDHVHLLLEVEEGRDIPRLVQLIKGALSRVLTVATGDKPAISTAGRGLLHHKWWTRQYSFRLVEDDQILQALRRALMEHEARGAAVRAEWSDHPADA